MLQETRSSTTNSQAVLGREHRSQDVRDNTHIGGRLSEANRLARIARQVLVLQQPYVLDPSSGQTHLVTILQTDTTPDTSPGPLRIDLPAVGPWTRQLRLRGLTEGRGGFAE